MILEGYGLSETSPVASFNHPDRARKPGSIGTPIRGVADAGGRRQRARTSRPGEVGEIAIRGHNVMKGYWRRADATAEAIPDGWFRSGDLGRIDEDGYFFIVDRKKDLIIRGGYNVYPREIEEVLYEHPAVAEAAVVGVPDASLGEEVGAAVVLRPGADATAEEIREYVKGQVAAYKYPRHVWLLDGAAEGADRQDSQARDPAAGRDEVGAMTARRRPHRTTTSRCRRPRRPARRAARRRRVRAAAPAACRTLSTAKLAGRAGRQPASHRPAAADPRRRARRGSAPARRSSHPAPRDRRFADPAWRQNPLLRRVVQAYLATGRTVDELIADARPGLARRPAGSVPRREPASRRWRRATSRCSTRRRRRRPSTPAGLSFVRGGLQPRARPGAAAAHPADGGRRRPSPSARTSRATPGAVVLRTEVFELIQYAPQTPTVREVPLLLVPPTINKFYALDLAPGRSWIEHLVRSGQQVFVLSWRNPDARHAGWGLDTYVQAVLDALDAVARICRTERAVLAGHLLRRHPRQPGRRRTSPAPAGRLAGLGARGHRARPPPGRHAGGPGRPLPRRRGHRRCRAGAAISTAGCSPRSSPGCARATWCGTTGSTTTCSAGSRRRSTCCSGTPTPPG